MSQLLRRISKLSLTKQPISSCFSTTTLNSKPYLFLGSKIKENVLMFNLYDPTKNKEVVKNLKLQDQSETLRNIFQESRTFGSSRGYLALRNRKDSCVHLVDISNQLKPKIIPLPPLNIDKREIHVNVSVSSPVNGDIIVAVKFYGSRLSLCRAGDSEWTRIDIPCPSFENSHVIYSEKDERFYLNNCNPRSKRDGRCYLDQRPSDYTGPSDFTPKSGLVTPVSGYLKFPISNISEFEKDFPSLTNSPVFKEHKKDLPDLSYLMVQEQLVESPSGQSFIVCWFIGYFNDKGEIVESAEQTKYTREKTYKIVVFKQDEEEEIGTYTDDIGDLCIFMGGNEAFCVSANDYPGLKPNSVYFAGRDSDFGFCDLSSQTIFYPSNNLTHQPYAVHSGSLLVLL